MKITMAKFRDVYNQFRKEEITMSRMIEIFNETKLGTPMAYEYHNHKDGHCFVEYDLGEVTSFNGIENLKEYTKTPLYKI